MENRTKQGVRIGKELKMSQKKFVWKGSKASFQYKVYKTLKSGNWKCRVCSYPGLEVTQIAGGGGIGGLKHGTSSRPGLIIQTRKHSCKKCKKKTYQDKWLGKTYNSVNAKNINKLLTKRILNIFNYTDVIELRRRQSHHLIIDHKFPMIRWGVSESKYSKDMSDEEIKKKFQLLKKDGSGNHNLLKSRACEECFKSEIRGKPLGINFFYEGNNKWSKNIPKKGPSSEKGCIGCGWYDLEKWKNKLNEFISSHQD